MKLLNEVLLKFPLAYISTVNKIINDIPEREIELNIPELNTKIWGYSLEEIQNTLQEMIQNKFFNYK